MPRAPAPFHSPPNILTPPKTLLAPQPVIPPIHHPHPTQSQQLPTPPPSTILRQSRPCVPRHHYFTPPRRHLSARELTSRSNTLGKNWLHKLGIIALVIGVRFFPALNFPRLATRTSGTSLSRHFASSDRTLTTSTQRSLSRLCARLIGGGWGAHFLRHPYAMLSVHYTRVIERIGKSI